MSKIAYFDCFSGCSGDMLLGALLDAGLEPETLREGLDRLGLQGYRLTVEKVERSSITATKFSVLTDDHHHEHHHRGLSEILDIINSSRLSDSVKKKSSMVFTRLGEVESRIHGVGIEEIQFHELGAVDTIVDIVGTIFALETLKIEKVYASPLAVGNGTVKTAHGILPVPAPATLQILTDARVPVTDAPLSDKPTGELLTPTGAVLISSLAESYQRPNMKVEQTGYGAGDKQFPSWPNVVRVWIGEDDKETADPEMVLLETNIDDMNPEIYGYLMENLFGAGALDVWFTPIQMKKNRPAVMLSVLSPVSLESKLAEIIMRETTTLGIRSRNISRHIAMREIIEVDSKLGCARAKVKRFGEFITVSPEYEDCRRLAQEHNLPLHEVSRIIEEAARKKLD